MQIVRLLTTILSVVIATTSALAEAPHITLFSPRGVVPEIRQVTATFSSPMVPFGSPNTPPAPFEIDCAEKGSGRWLNESSWVYDFDRTIPSGVSCTFRLNPDIKSNQGLIVDGEREFSFSTGGPRVESLWPNSPNPIPEDQAFILRLTGEATQESIIKNAFFEVKDILDPIPLRIIEGADRKEILESLDFYPDDERTVVVQAKRAFPLETSVSMVWSKGIVSPSSVALDVDQVFRFNTRGEFSAYFDCTRTNPREDCVPFRPLVLSLTEYVEGELLKGAVLTDHEGKTYGWDKQRSLGDGTSSNRFVFVGPFPPGSTLSLTLPDSIRDLSGRTIPSTTDRTLVVKTAPYPPLVKFGASFGIVERSDPVLPITVRNIEPAISGGTSPGPLAPPIGKLSGTIAPVRSPNEVLSILRKVIDTGGNTSLLKASASDTKPLDPGSGSHPFTLPRPEGKEAFEVIGIPLPGPGLHIVEVQSEILGEKLFLNPAPMYVRTAALVTNMAVHFKRGHSNSLAWVTALDSGKPLADARVTFSDCTGKAWARATTNRDGIATFDSLPLDGDLPRCNQIYETFIVTAERGDDFSFVLPSWNDGLEPWRFNIPAAWNLDSEKPLTIHSVLAQSLLRRGDTVHLKHVARVRSLAGLEAAPLSSLPTEMTLYHSGSGEEYTTPITWRAGGYSDVSWQIPLGAKLGEYSIKLSTPRKPSKLFGADDQIDSGSFRVEDFKLPIIQPILNLPSTPTVAGTPISITIGARYLAGGPASGLQGKVRYRTDRRGPDFGREYREYRFNSGPVKTGPSHDLESKYPTPYKTIDVTLDATGSTHATLPPLLEIRESLAVQLEYEFRDPAGETHTISGSIPVSPADIAVAVKPDNWGQKVEDAAVHVVVLDLKGQPKADTPVVIDLFQTKSFSHRKRVVGGFYAYDFSTETSRIDTVCRGRTDDKGLLHCVFDSPVGGDVSVEARATDGSGKDVASSVQFSLYDSSESWFQQDDTDRMDLVLPKKNFEVGEIIDVQVRSPFRKATALVTVEREGIADAFIAELTGKDPVVHVPVKASYAPNMFISVLAIRGRVHDSKPTATIDLGRPAYKVGLTEIKVGRAHHTLTVGVTTDAQSYAPRGVAHTTIQVTEPTTTTGLGRGEVSVAVIDEALLELFPNSSWNLLDAMMGDRLYQVQSSSAQLHVVGKRHFGLKALPGGAGGGKQPTRELFDALVLWKSSVPLRKDGSAVLEIPLNDSLSSFRVVAVASSGTSLFGTGSTTIRTAQDLMTFSGVPSVGRAGDTVYAPFTLRNASEKPLHIGATLKVPELNFAGSVIDLRLNPGESREIDWQISVPSERGILTYEMTATDLDAPEAKPLDTLRVTQSISELAEVKTIQGSLLSISSAPTRIPVQHPADAHPTRGGLVVTFSPSLTTSLKGVIEYMKRYPYGCLEQQVSKAITINDDAQWRGLLENLPQYIDSNGLLKFFPSPSIRGLTHLTSYVLSAAHAAGKKFPDEIRDTMLDSLVRAITSPTKENDELRGSYSALTRIFALDALSRYGRVSPDMLTGPIDPSYLPISALSSLVSLYSRMPGAEFRAERERVLTVLRARLNTQGTELTLSTGINEDMWWLLYSPDTAVNYTLLVLLEQGLFRDEVAKITKGAVQRQRNGRWDLTTANTFGATALRLFGSRHERVAVTGASVATLDRRTESLSWERSPAGASVQFAPPTVATELTLNHQGSGSPWAVIESRAAIERHESINAGYKLTKEIIRVTTAKPGTIQRGDLALVRISIEATADRTWVALTDAIPPGAVVLGGGLNRNQSMTDDNANSMSVYPAFTERSFRGITAYFDELPQGSTTFEYTIRYNTEGRFKLPGTRIEAMYSPGMFGELPIESVVVGSR